MVYANIGFGYLCANCQFNDFAERNLRRQLLVIQTIFQQSGEWIQVIILRPAVKIYTTGIASLQRGSDFL